MRHESGFALALVLWVMVLLSAVGISLGYAVRVETAGAIEMVERTQADALAAAGVRLAVLGVLATEPDQQWRPDGRLYDIAWAGANLRVTMRSESGKIDLNYAPAPLLAGLIEQVLPEAESESLAAAVIDWRDSNDLATVGGAEAGDYRGAGRWGPANGPFQSVGELAMVLGFDAVAAAKLMPYLTVFSRNPRVDPRSADRVALAAVPGIGPELADQFVTQREELMASGELPDLAQLAAGSRYLDARSATRIITVLSTAKLVGGAAATLEATVDVREYDRPYAFLDWRPVFEDSAEPALSAAEGG